MNKYRSLGVYLNGRNPFRVIFLKTFSSEAVVEDELWGFNTSNHISPRTINTRNAALFGILSERFSFITPLQKDHDPERDLSNRDQPILVTEW